MRNYEYILTNLNTSDVKTLKAAPADWNKLERNYDRSKFYHGIFRMYTGSMRFTNVGGEILDKGGYWWLLDIYNTDKIKGRVKIERKKLNYITKAYDDDLVGIIDFTSENGFKINKTEKFIEAKFIDSSKLQIFAANDSKNISLSSETAINGNAITPFANSPKDIVLPDISLYLEGKTNGIHTGTYSNLTTPQSITVPYSREITIREMGDRLIETGDRIYNNTIGTFVNMTVNLQMDYHFAWTYTPLVSGNNLARWTSRILIDVYDEFGGRQDIIVYATDTQQIQDAVLQPPQPLVFEGSIDSSNDIVVPVDGYVLFVCELVVTTADDMSLSATVDNTVQNNQYIEVYPSSSVDVDAWLPLELTSRVLQVITGETDTSKLIYSDKFGRTDSEFQSYPLDGDLAYLATTNGRTIRKYPDTNIVLNFRDWFKTIDNMDNIALWHDKQNDRFRIEEKEKVYKDELIVDFGVVSNVKITPGKYSSELLTGTREKGDYEQQQGALEYNIQSEHSIDLPIKTNLDLRTPYNTDTLTAEYAKRNPYIDTASTDTKQDDKVIILETDNTLEVIQNGEDYTGFTGVDERYNGNRTPRKCVINNGNWIKGLLITDEVIKFENNSKDINITYPNPTDTGTINETDSIVKAELATELFYPETFEFDFQITQDQIQQIENDPHGYFRAELDDNEVEYMYALTLKINDYENKGSGTFVKANINR